MLSSILRLAASGNRSSYSAYMIIGCPCLWTEKNMQKKKEQEIKKTQSRNVNWRLTSEIVDWYHVGAKVANLLKCLINMINHNKVIVYRRVQNKYSKWSVFRRKPYSVYHGLFFTDNVLWTRGGCGRSSRDAYSSMATDPTSCF